MRIIYKYPVPDEGAPTVFELELPDDSYMAHFGRDPESKLCLWVDHVPEAPKIKWKFYLIGTGHEVPDNLLHMFSYVDDAHVWHLYTDYVPNAQENTLNMTFTRIENPGFSLAELAGMLNSMAAGKKPTQN